ncbi:MAG TPA: hypothetical protein VGQ71_15140 [Terriglobales bacterium]|jgi:RNA polymerase sigma-70 factor (ECF subfamily)|nr:hypothetical protein [Terriglobales bacterium]
MCAQLPDSPHAKEALEKLCRAYWYPLYAYIRRLGYTAEDAEDLTQAYFYQLLQKNFLGVVDRRRGKFRSFLLAALGHFLANEHDFRNALKRGGGQTFIDLDTATAEERYLLEPESDALPEKTYDRDWAEQIMKTALASLREQYATEGKAPLFDRLAVFLDKEASPGDYAIAAGELAMSVHAVTMAVHRLRERLGKQVRAVITPTVARPEEIESEMHYIAAILQSARL